MNGVNDPDHSIMVTLNSFYTTPLRQPGLKVDNMAFAPVARMAEDTFVLWVHKDEGITTFDEFIAEVKKRGNKWVMGGTGKNSEDNIITDHLNEAYGYESGDVVPIVAFTNERLPMFPDTPTHNEVSDGDDFAYFMQRSVVGAPGMSDEAQAYYTALFTKVYESDAWQKYKNDKLLMGDFMSGEELSEYWGVQIENHEKILKASGAIK